MFYADHLIYILPIGIGIYYLIIMLDKHSKAEIQSTDCYCPECHNELISSESFVSDDECVVYQCSECREVSKWNFDIAPVPILIRNRKVRQ